MPNSIKVALALLALGATPARERTSAVVLPRAAADSMNAVFLRHNQRWDELTDLNTLEKMLGAAPGPREYLGCLQGRREGDTLRITGWTEARGLKQLPLAVTGDCAGTPDLVGTFHTHPYRADLANLPVKERRLSAQDLETFRSSADLVVLVVWDEDSLDAAVRSDGRVVHPAPVLVR